MRYSDDPIADFDAYDREQAKEMDKLPRCEHCGEPIQDEYFYLIGDEAYCADCLESEFCKRTEDYIE